MGPIRAARLAKRQAAVALAAATKEAPIDLDDDSEDEVNDMPLSRKDLKDRAMKGLTKRGGGGGGAADGSKGAKAGKKGKAK